MDLNFLLFVASLISPAQADTEMLFDLNLPEKMHRVRLHKQPRSPALRLGNEEDVKSLFGTPASVGGNLETIPPAKEGRGTLPDIYPTYDEPQPCPSLWQQLQLSLESIENNDNGENTSYLSQASVFARQIAKKVQIAEYLHLNFIQGRSSGFFRTSIILEKHRDTIREKLLNSSSLHLILGVVFSQFFKNDREQNEYRYKHKPIPKEFRPVG